MRLVKPEIPIVSNQAVTNNDIGDNTNNDIGDNTNILLKRLLFVL